MGTPPKVLSLDQLHLTSWVRPAGRGWFCGQPPSPPTVGTQLDGASPSWPPWLCTASCRPGPPLPTPPKHMIRCHLHPHPPVLLGPPPASASCSQPCPALPWHMSTMKQRSGWFPGQVYGVWPLLPALGLHAPLPVHAIPSTCRLNPLQHTLPHPWKTEPPTTSHLL